MRFVSRPSAAPEASLSPILVRPVREQLEHDRVIRLLQHDLQKKKVEVGINPGYEQNAGVGSGARKEFPDAVIYSLDKGRKVVAVVEVETGESVNDLEAKAQWAHLAKLRVPFHLYVPMGSVDVARRLSADNQIAVSEIWSYHQVGEQFKFTLIHPPGSGKGKSAQALRTVSVSTIRVPIPDPEAVAVEQSAPPPPPASVTSKAPRVIPAKGKAIPAVAAKAPAADKAPVPAKPAVAAKAVVAAKAAPAGKAAGSAAAKAPLPAKAAAPVKSAAPVKLPAAKLAKAPAKAPAKAVVAAKPVKPPVKPVVRSAAPKKAAKPVAKASVKATRPSKPARPATKAPARKPSGKRK
jgi:hypothetical protein